MTLFLSWLLVCLLHEYLMAHGHSSSKEVTARTHVSHNSLGTPYNRLRNIIGGKPKSGTEEQEKLGVVQQCETDEPLQGCPEELAELSASDVRYAFMKTVLEPFILERAVTNLYDVRSFPLLTRPSAEHYHRPSRASGSAPCVKSLQQDTKVSKSSQVMSEPISKGTCESFTRLVYSLLTQNSQTQHTPWKDVLVAARVQDGEEITWQCQTPNCDFT